MNNRSKVQTAVVFRPSSRGSKSRHLSKTPLQRHEETRPTSGRYGPNLQVQGFGCPLLHRPGSGQPSPPRPSPKPDQSSTTSLLLLTTIKDKLESRVLPALRPRAGPKSGLSKIPTPCVSNISATEMAPANPRKSQVQIGSVPELHLYLPSTEFDEEDDNDTQDFRTRAEPSHPQESEVKANSPDPPPLPNSSRTSEDQAAPGPSTTSPSAPHPYDITLDMGPRDLTQPLPDQ